MRVNKTKYFLVVAGVTLGFAAFSNTLTIQSSATVTPDASTFSVKFSSSSDSVVEGGIEGITMFNNASVATINNTGNPTLSNISVEWVNEGINSMSYVTYSFYIYNDGKYDVYLNEIKFNKVDGIDKHVACTIPEGLMLPLH